MSGILKRRKRYYVDCRVIHCPIVTEKLTSGHRWHRLGYCPGALLLNVLQESIE